MSPMPDPAWPVVLLALVQAVDAVLCVGPVPFVRRCLEDVAFPRRMWWVLPWVKAAAAAGLLLGLVVPHLAHVTTLALVLYFLVAIAMHLRARDLGRTLFVNATGMLALCAGTAAWCFW